jgi:serine/threonine-protein kinase HipA
MSENHRYQEIGRIQKADVYKGEALAAHLTRTKEGVKFEYTPEYLATSLPQIAHTLPKKEEPKLVAAGGIPSFFAGLLPEGRRLHVLQRAIKTSADDELSLLLAIGTDVIGDVKIMPHGDTPSTANPLVEVKKTFEEIKFADLLNEFAEVDRVGIPGMQEKVSARRIWLSASKAGSQYILKLGSPDYPLIIENEDYFLQAARQTLKSVVRSELVHDSEGKSGLLVTRFDRIINEQGKSLSLATEDACQVLDKWPADKYNMSSENIIEEVSKVCSSQKLAARELYRQFCFAWLTGNGDLHAKNISILSTEDGEWKISPAYDLPSTLFYGDNSLALTIGGKKVGHSRRSLVEFGVTVGMSEKLATKVLDEALDATSTVLSDLRDGRLPFDQQTISNAWAELRHRHQTASKG